MYLGRGISALCCVEQINKGQGFNFVIARILDNLGHLKAF